MTRFYFILISVSLLFIQCSQKPLGVSDNNNGTSQEQGQILLKMSMTVAPAEVVGLRGMLSRDKSDTIWFRFEISGGYATAKIENLIAGLWHLQVDAFNGENVVIYTGRTSVQVLPGTITPVNLHLNPTTGGLDIIVTWGNNSFLDSALVAYYPFNGNARDESGNLNHGKVVDAQLTVDRNNNDQTAYYFDGSKSYIALPSDFDIPTRSISLWFNADRPERFDYYHRIYYSDHPGLEYSSTNIDIYHDYYSNEEVLRMEAGGGQGDDILTVIKMNQWYHAVLTIDSIEVKAYINGDLIDTVPFVNHHSDAGDSVAYIGTNRDTNNYFFRGSIDDVRIYNRVIDAEDVLELFYEE